MTSDEFNALVFKLEDQARKDPAGYRRRVMLLALLGNAYLGFVLLLITALFLALLASILVLKAVGLKLALVVGIFLWMIIKALSIKLLPPEGTEVRLNEASGLFGIIDELRRELEAPCFDHVLVTDGFNAGVVQSPRLGIFGWSPNYLLIGLPLMKSLTIEQFKAVLAHEFGHLAKNHGRMSNWIYRQRLRWSRLLDTLEATESSGAFLFKPFLKWYSPYFNAYSFPLARANEYEADATAVRLTSPRTAAEALTSVHVVSSYLGERYWPAIHKQADDLPQPGFGPYSGMGQHVATELDEASTKTWIERALAQRTTSDDTHPGLADRLQAIGESPRLAKPNPGAAADQLLGSALATVTATLDRRWHDNILASWRERHNEVQEGRRRLAELDTLHAGGGTLSLQDAVERAKLTGSIGNNADAAIEQFRALLEREPNDAVINFNLGVRLLTRDDERGCDLVKRATELDENGIVSGYEVLRDYYWRHERKEEARAAHQRMVERIEVEQAAYKERKLVTLRDKFDKPDLPEKVLAELRGQLQAVPGLRKAYFMQMRVAYLPHRPCYVLGFAVAGPFRFHTKKRAAEVLAKIQETVRFPGETLIINVEGENYRFGRKFRWMRRSRIL